MTPKDLVLSYNPNATYNAQTNVISDGKRFIVSIPYEFAKSAKNGKINAQQAEQYAWQYCANRLKSENKL